MYNHLYLRDILHVKEIFSRCQNTRKLCELRRPKLWQTFQSFADQTTSTKFFYNLKKKFKRAEGSARIVNRIKITKFAADVFFTLYRVSTKLVALFYLKCLCVDMEDDLVQFWCGNGLACLHEAEELVIWAMAWKLIVVLWFLLCNAFRSILLNCVYLP